MNTKHHPIFVPLSEIALRKDTFTNHDDGLITITPIRDVLHGFRCTERDDWRAEFEHCGPREPMKWLGKLWSRTYYKNGMRTIAAKYPQDSIGFMQAMPIGCIALAPQESGGYRVIGSDKTTLRFISGMVTMMEYPDDIAGFELANYEPLPFMNCDVQVECEDITEKELIERLDNLIRK